MTKLPTVTLGRPEDGVELPMVGYGTWPMRGETAYQGVLRALEAGYRHIDTATMYGNEAEVGRAVRDSGLAREEVFLTTKLRAGDADRADAVLAESLRALGTDYLDLWLIHSPPPRGSGLTAWQRLLAAQQAGRARAVGVSNYHPQDLDWLARESGRMPAVNQIPWSPARHDPALLAAHRAPHRNVLVEGYSPIKGTNLRDRVLTEIADRHRVSAARVVLRWHLEHGIPVIPKSADPARIASNFDLYGFSLTEAEVTRIDALSAVAH